MNSIKTSTCYALALVVYIIARKEVCWSSHGLKLQVISTTIFKEPAEDKENFKTNRSTLSTALQADLRTAGVV